jgi:hypothetical protein
MTPTGFTHPTGRNPDAVPSGTKRFVLRCLVSELAAAFRMTSRASAYAWIQQSGGVAPRARWRSASQSRTSVLDLRPVLSRRSPRRVMSPIGFWTLFGTSRDVVARIRYVHGDAEAAKAID